ncbi:hypothetical protein VTO73DRAFT_443 [Trametes versicolor]
MLVKLATFLAVVTLTAATPMPQASGTPKCTTGTLQCCTALPLENPSAFGIDDLPGDLIDFSKEKRSGEDGLLCDAETGEGLPCLSQLLCCDGDTNTLGLATKGCNPPIYVMT